MTPNNDRNYRDLITRIAQLEYRLTRIESTQTQLENTMTPGGYITEAFERVHSEIDALRGNMWKIDIILRHITGQGNT
jgi:hypothetical protein